MQKNRHKINLLIISLFCFSGIWAQNMDNELLMAADKGDLKEVLKLVRKGADVNCTDYNGVTPLMFAAEKGHSGVVRTLVQYGANVNQLPDDKTSALLAAARFNQVEIVELLLLNGANAQLKDIYGANALHYCAAYGYPYLLNFLLEEGLKPTKANDGYMPLHIAAALGDSIITAILLKHGHEINCVDNQKYTPLMLAAQNGHLHILKMLNEASVNLQTDKGVTALHLSVQNQHRQVADYLLQLDSTNANLRAYGKLRPLEFAMIDRNTEFTKMLRRHTKGYVLKMNEWDLSANHLISRKDYIFSLEFAQAELNTKLGYFVEAGIRVVPKKIWIEKEDFYLQLFERRSQFTVGFFRDWWLTPDMGLRTGAGFRAYLGQYRGTLQNINTPYAFVPTASYFVKAGNVRLNLGYQYAQIYPELNFNGSPHWFSIGLGVQLSTGKYQKYNRAAVWY